MTSRSGTTMTSLGNAYKELSGTIHRGDGEWRTTFLQSNKIRLSLRRWKKLARSLLLAFFALAMLTETACSNDEYGPYHVIGYNYTDRHIYLFSIDDFGAGSSEAHQSGGGGGITCCLSIPASAKFLHVKIVYEWTEEQYEKKSPHDTFETDIPVPNLSSKTKGYIEVHFLPNQRIEAQWVDFPTTPHIPNATN